jgi:hypothetical protein
VYFLPIDLIKPDNTNSMNSVIDDNLIDGFYEEHDDQCILFDEDEFRFTFQRLGDIIVVNEKVPFIAAFFCWLKENYFNKFIQVDEGLTSVNRDLLIAHFNVSYYPNDCNKMTLIFNDAKIKMLNDDTLKYIARFAPHKYHLLVCKDWYKHFKGSEFNYSYTHKDNLYLTASPYYESFERKHYGYYNDLCFNSLKFFYTSQYEITKKERQERRSRNKFGDEIVTYENVEVIAKHEAQSISIEYSNDTLPYLNSIFNYIEDVLPDCTNINFTTKEHSKYLLLHIAYYAFKHNLSIYAISVHTIVVRKGTPYGYRKQTRRECLRKGYNGLNISFEVTNNCISSKSEGKVYLGEIHGLNLYLE